MFEKIDFKNGVISCCDETLQEGMLEVMYPRGLLIAAGWNSSEGYFDLYEVKVDAPDKALREAHPKEAGDLHATLQGWIDEASRL